MEGCPHGGVFYRAAFYGRPIFNQFIYSIHRPEFNLWCSRLIILVIGEYGFDSLYGSRHTLYIGAEFTQVYAEASGSRIEPAEYAVSVQQTEV